jgi:tRNA 2-thiouridine synthesizing protein C
LGDYEVKYIYVDRDSLEARGLTADDLVAVAWEDIDTGEERENIVEVVDAARVTELMEESDVIFSF